MHKLVLFLTCQTVERPTTDVITPDGVAAELIERDIRRILTHIKVRSVQIGSHAYKSIDLNTRGLKHMRSVYNDCVSGEKMPSRLPIKSDDPAFPSFYLLPIVIETDEMPEDPLEPARQSEGDRWMDAIGARAPQDTVDIMSHELAAEVQLAGYLDMRRMLGISMMDGNHWQGFAELLYAYVRKVPYTHVSKFGVKCVYDPMIEDEILIPFHTMQSWGRFGLHKGNGMLSPARSYILFFREFVRHMMVLKNVHGVPTRALKPSPQIACNDDDEILSMANNLALTQDWHEDLSPAFSIKRGATSATIFEQICSGSVRMRYRVILHYPSGADQLFGDYYPLIPGVTKKLIKHIQSTLSEMDIDVSHEEQMLNHEAEVISAG